jgi:hypothetical protein
MLTSLVSLLAATAGSQPVSGAELVAPGARFDPAAIGAAGTPDPDRWRQYGGLYFMAAGLDGKATVDGVDANVDVDFADILDHLDFGAMAVYRAESKSSMWTLDAIYMGLGAEKDDGPLSTKVGFDELVVEAAGGWRVTPQTDVFAGLRYWSLEADVDIDGGGPGIDADGSQHWIDPLIGARHTFQISEPWSVTLRGDVGGFGVGSDFSWQAVARVSWEFSESAWLTLGYRVVDVDYRDGSGSDEFRYDVTTSGFLLGVIFGW